MKLNYDPNILMLPESIEAEDFIIATYYLATETRDALKRAEALALEQSTGTWVDVPEETPQVRARHTAKVIGVYEVPPYEFALPEGPGERQFVVQVAFPTLNIGVQLPELLTTMLGNVSMTGKVKLLDITFPQKWLANFQGPRFGASGVRELLGVPERPLLMSITKPSIGIPPETIGRLAYEMAMGGVDIIKDDELLADPDYCAVVERVKAVMPTLRRAYEETGEQTIYCVNITDEVDRMVEKARRVIELGGNGIMVNFTPVGLSALRMLAEHPELNVPIWAHPAFAGAVYQSHYSGVSSWLHLGKLLRIAGADMMVYPSTYGKVTILKERYVRVAQALLAPFYHFKPVLPAPGAGMNQALVSQTLADLGSDAIIGAGGAVHGHPMGTRAGAHSMRLVIDAAMDGVPLEEVAREHEEVRVALERWGATSEDAGAFTLRQ